ncbi:putative Oxygen-evolving enhancer protein 2, chloroplast precursor [Hibiscus syriacus]|uniref:Oxygen-evolving enhancer protein 2, chloroplast n=1 Tax=Hibiscus syriacus TaxID=106335 RepID=A0A6A2ZUF6_HIBSY|nr:putative Oxygen-evolving enhancer protein 2, chloroplast precursor [Hibiscus syriacus]
MVDLVAAQKPLLHGLLKISGVQPFTVELEPGTVMNFCVPCETIKKPKKGIVTWQFHVGALTKKYSVYIPDILFFGGSITEKPDRSPTFQAEYLIKGLRKLGVEHCAVVGFSYGGMVHLRWLNFTLIWSMPWWSLARSWP